MGTIARGAKAAGGTDFTTGAAIATEVNTDLNTVYSEVNGNLDENNISASAQIPNSSLVKIASDKVDDHAATEAQFLSESPPGDSGTPQRPTTLSGELEKIRFQIRQNNGYLDSASYMDTAGVIQDAGWPEPPIKGRNLFPNAGFELQSGAANSAPDGWALVGTPTTVAIKSAGDPLSGVDKRSLNIVAAAGNEGISVTITGLKKSFKYLIGMMYVSTTGKINLTTTNGLSSGEYKNLVFNDATATGVIKIFQGIVKTDSTPTDITVKILSSDAADDFNLSYVWFYELSAAAPIEAPHIPMQTVTYTTADDSTTNAGAGAWVTKTDLSITQYVPYEGYRFIYEVTLCFESGDVGSGSTGMELAFRLQQNIDAGGATTVEGPVAFTGELKGDTTDRHGGAISLKYIIENPTPGSSYVFTVDVWTEGTSAAVDVITFNPTLGAGALATQSSARLYTERI